MKICQYLDVSQNVSEMQTKELKVCFTGWDLQCYIDFGTEYEKKEKKITNFFYEQWTKIYSKKQTQWATSECMSLRFYVTINSYRTKSYQCVYAESNLRIKIKDNLIISELGMSKLAKQVFRDTSSSLSWGAMSVSVDKGNWKTVKIFSCWK